MQLGTVRRLRPPIRTCRIALLGPAVAHRVLGLFANSVRLVADQGNDHAVEVEEEHQKVETKFDEGFLESESQFLSHADL